MTFYLSKFLSLWLLPPAIFVLLLIVGLVLLRYHATIGRWVIGVTAAVLLMLSLPVVSMLLMAIVEPYPAVTPAHLDSAQAIVILSAGRDFKAPEYGGRDTVGHLTLQRIRYGAYLHRHTGLPILVTGGSLLEGRVSLAKLMAEVLTDDFKISATWIEDASRTTAENAIFSRGILEAEGIDRIALVSHAWHMYRAVRIFEKQGFEVAPAPTGFEGYSGNTFVFTDFLPNMTAFHETYYALHELIGQAWYAMRY